MQKDEMRIPYVGLCKGVAGALTALAVSAEMAELEVKAMAEADLQGVPSHGVRMLPGLLQAIRDGRVKADPNIRLIREFGATCLLDGDNGPGRTVACRAMDLAVLRAKQFGTGVCLAIRASHWGRAHYSRPEIGAALTPIPVNSLLP
ncbi:MAG: Ldh family oxidoreductase [Pseudomonadota bacterium]